MKKLLIFLCAFVCLHYHANASHAAGAEITYKWLHDSTYQVFYHFYRDCKGIPEPSIIDLCYQASSSCGLSGGTATLNKMSTIPPGVDNGTEVIVACPGRPTTCVSDTSTIPGYREWWYQGTITLTGKCDSWTFSHSESARNNALINIASPGSYTLYVEATLNNIDAPHNSSAYFTVKPVPYLCNNVPYTYNNGAFDDDNDSLNIENVSPLSGTGCPPASAISLAGCCSLPTNPLPTGGTFVLNNSTGQMSFTPNAVGPSAIAFRINEYRNISGTWKKIGSVMRDIQVIVRPCTTPTPTSVGVPASISGGTLTGGTIYVCAETPLNFCYDAKAGATGHVLTVKDNHLLLHGNSTVNYTGMYTDSVRGCLSWIPSNLDSGLKVYTVTATDSTCTGIGIPISSTTAIPIFVSPATHIQFDGLDTICSGDYVQLNASGGGGYIWSVLPGGATGSLSCMSCYNPVVSPWITTTYTVRATSPMLCKDADTVTIHVISSLTPSVTLTMTPPTISAFVNDTFTATAVDCGPSPIYTWYKNGTVIPGATTDTYIGHPPFDLKRGDVIKVRVKSIVACAIPDSAVASTFPLNEQQVLKNKNTAALYPNPNSGSFRIYANFTMATDNATIEIMNAIGQVVFTEKVAVSNHILDKQLQLPATTPNGIYTVRVIQQDESFVLKLNLSR